jgi:hypothetical protein
MQHALEVDIKYTLVLTKSEANRLTKVLIEYKRICKDTLPEGVEMNEGDSILCNAIINELSRTTAHSLEDSRYLPTDTEFWKESV